MSFLNDSVVEETSIKTRLASPGTETILHILVSVCRSGSTMLLKFFSQNPNVQPAYQPVKAGLRESGTSNYSLFEADSHKPIVSKETLGPHTLEEAIVPIFENPKEDVVRTRPIFLIRNPVNTFNSWLHENWTKLDVFNASWISLGAQFKQAQQVAPNSVLVVRYEDLVGPYKEYYFKSICAHWNLKFDPSWLTLEKPINLDPSHPGTVDFIQSQAEGSFDDVERMTEIKKTGKPSIVPETIKGKITDGLPMIIYNEMSSFCYSPDISKDVLNDAASENAPISDNPNGDMSVFGERLDGLPLIIATIGPGHPNGVRNDSEETIKGLIQSGARIFRLNYSHGTLHEKEIIMKRIRSVAKKIGIEIEILADIPGPKIRLGRFPGEAVLNTGQTVELHCGVPAVTCLSELLSSESTAHALPVEYAGLSADLCVNDSVYISDGLLHLKVISSANNSEGKVYCQVLIGGVVTQRKGINCPNTAVGLPAVGKEDKKLIEHAVKNGVSSIAISYVRNATDLKPAQEMLRNLGSEACLIAKIEHPRALCNLDEILAGADGAMVARGDLGIEIPIAKVPAAQARIIKACQRIGKPVIVATQMLESMLDHPRPTRAEVSDINTAVRQGANAIMLSGETASGKYPVEAVAMMRAIADEAKSSLLDNVE